MTTMRTPSPQTTSPIAQRVSAALCNEGTPQLADVICETEGSKVTLRGELPTYYFKQLAQTIALKTPGVEQVINQIAVINSPNPLCTNVRMQG